MADRLDLHAELIKILGSNNVYFQPPENVKIVYPCIIYRLNSVDTLFANDKPFSKHKSYSVTIIDKNPDSLLPDILADLPLCNFSRYYTSSNLHHYVYTIYF